jgi:Bacteriophage protein of unknown function (DUF646).
MPASITITGDKPVIAKFDKMKTDLPKATQQALQNAANNVVQVARQNAPYLTGYLRSQIAVETITPTSTTIVSGAEYSIYQRVDFMGIALQSSQATFLRELQTAISRVVGK